MESNGLRRIENRGIFIPRYFNGGIENISEDALIVPLNWGYNCNLFEKELEQLLIKYKLCKSLDDIPAI